MGMNIGAHLFALLAANCLPAAVFSIPSVPPGLCFEVGLYCLPAYGRKNENAK
jgi:hypothetical protein